MPGSVTSTRSSDGPACPTTWLPWSIRSTDGSTSLVLVNLNQGEPRELIVQGGGYGEHLCEEVAAGRRDRPCSSTRLSRLAGGLRGIRRPADDQDETIPGDADPCARRGK